MSCHYKPYCEHYRSKKLLHKTKSGDNKTKSFNGGAVTTKNKTKKSALLIIDVQNDFLPGGALAVMQGTPDHGVSRCEMMINSINELIKSDVFDMYVFTQDAHPPGHVSFASSHPDKEPFDVIKLKNDKQVQYPQVLWPDHCRTDGEHGGMNFSNKLILPFDTERCVEMYAESVYIKEPITSCAKPATADSTVLMKNLAAKSHILWKGQDKDTDSYSAFKDAQQRETGLRKFLMSNGITDIYVCGLARDFCVWWSAVDATSYVNADTNKNEFNVHFIWDATLPVPGPSSLPDYDVEGPSLHQKAVKRIGVETVHNDLEKNSIVGNNWIKAFLEPYGVEAVSWETLVGSDESSDSSEQISDKEKESESDESESGNKPFKPVRSNASNVSKSGQKGGSIFVKQKKVVKNTQKIEVGTEVKDFLYHMFKQN